MIFFSQETEFEAIVTVNVTLLLVLTTLFIGISNALPKTAYIKVRLDAMRDSTPYK